MGQKHGSITKQTYIYKPISITMVMSLKHIVVLTMTLTFMFFGMLGTCCQDGACGGDEKGWQYVGYFGWGLGLASTCVGIITSLGGGSSDLNKMEEEKAAAAAAHV